MHLGSGLKREQEEEPRIYQTGVPSRPAEKEEWADPEELDEIFRRTYRSYGEEEQAGKEVGAYKKQGESALPDRADFIRTEGREKNICWWTAIILFSRGTS